MFIRTTAINKLLKMEQRIKVVQGGTSAGKTYGIIPCIIDYATKHPNKKITIVAETLPAVKEGALDIFKKVMGDTNRWVESRFIQNPIQYTFANGSIIQFKSFDTVGKAKAAGKRDMLFLNEANHIPFEIADALMIRSISTWIDFNPDNEFWVHTHVLTHPESEFLLLTYKDNEGIPAETIRDLEIKKEWAKTSSYWANWCKVYIDGEIGSLQDVIFSNWKRIDDKPPRFSKYVYGLDFGFIHPTALVRVWYYENELYLEPLIYESKLRSVDLVNRFKEFNIEYNVEILADYARPELIADLQNEGYEVMNANKSVQYGIDAVRYFQVYYSSEDLHREYISYRHKKVKDELTDDPLKTNDDLMDAVRYGAVYIRTNFIYDSAYMTL